MDRSWKSGAAIVWLACVSPCATAAVEQELLAGDAAHYGGPLRAAGANPFGFLRLEMRPSAVDASAPGRWTIETDLAYQNTWALSDPVEDYLQTLDGRRALGPAEIEAIRGLHGENYLVDLEITQLDVSVQRQLAPHWAAYAILSGVEYGGGVLDGAVEQFHSGVGATDYGRESVRRGQVNVLMHLRSGEHAAIGVAPAPGLLDPVLGVRYSGFAVPAPWRVVVEAAAKVPVAGERPWLSTGRTDLGLQATALRAGTRHAVYGSASLVWYGGAGNAGLMAGLVPEEARLQPALALGVESRLTARTHSVVQLNASPGVYDSAATGLAQLRGPRFVLAAGLRYERGRHRITSAITENVGNTRNTPDIGLQFGWAFLPR